jgi:hypothetical protein
VWWLEVLDHDRGAVAVRHPVAVGDEFELEHTHSVHRRPVVEVFSVDASGQVAMEEMRFDRMGANLPFGEETVEGVRTTFIDDGDTFRVLHHGRPLGTVPMRVGGQDVDHVLRMPGGRVIRFLDHAPRGTFLELRISGATVG